MKEKELDYILVPLGIAILGLYHIWLLFTIHFYPAETIIGTNAQSRSQWVFTMMNDPMGNGVLAVQTIRNNIMASTVLATAAISLSALISVYISSSSDADSISSELVYGNKTDIISSIKYFTILLCFLLAFLCNVQCIRELHAVNRVLVTMQQRLVTANADMEVLLGKPNQQVAVKQYLTTKIKKVMSSGDVEDIEDFYATISSDQDDNSTSVTQDGATS